MPKLTCREVIDFLDEYTDGNQTADVRANFERHMEDCPYCVEYLKTYRDTVSLARDACSTDPSLPAPDDVPEKLIRAILKSRTPNT